MANAAGFAVSGPNSKIGSSPQHSAQPFPTACERSKLTFTADDRVPVGTIDAIVLTSSRNAHGCAARRNTSAESVTTKGSTRSGACEWRGGLPRSDHSFPAPRRSLLPDLKIAPNGGYASVFAKAAAAVDDGGLGSGPEGVVHDPVVGAAAWAARALRRVSICGEGPAVQLYQIALGAAPLQPGMRDGAGTSTGTARRGSRSHGRQYQHQSATGHPDVAAARELGQPCPTARNLDDRHVMRVGDMPVGERVLRRALAGCDS
jgi:hypothetical protein